MDALLTHLWAILAHPLHGHMPLRAGFLAHSLVQDKAPFTSLAVGGISFTFSARGATAFAYAFFCIEALRAPGVASAFVEEERVFQLRLALVAEIGSRAGGAGLCTVLTAATPHGGPRAFGTGGDAGLSQQIRAFRA